MANTYTLISSNVLSSSAASVTFSSIPATYTDLLIRLSTRTDRSSTFDSTGITINSDTGTNYSYTYLKGNGTSASSYFAANDTVLSVQNTDASTATANTFGSAEIYIPNYLSTTSKPISSISMREDNSNSAFPYNSAQAYLYRNTSAITSLLFAPLTGPNYVSGSSFYLYGIKNS